MKYSALLNLLQLFFVHGSSFPNRYTDKYTCQPPKKTSLKLTVTTTEGLKMGTDSSIFLDLRGELNSVLNLPLDNPIKNDFESGQTDVFVIEMQYMLCLRHAVFHNTQVKKDSWIMKKAIFQNLENQEECHIFDANGPVGLQKTANFLCQFLRELPTLTFFRCRYCPDSISVYIALLEKKIHFNCIDIDLPTKLTINPDSSAPFLTQNGKVVSGAYNCLKYLDYIYRTPNLPYNITVEYVNRVNKWALFVDVELIPRFVTLLENDTFHGTDTNCVYSNMNIFVTAMSLDRGYFMGERLTIVDILAYPWIAMFLALKIDISVSLKGNNNLRFGEWIKACNTSKAVTDGINQMPAHLYKEYKEKEAQRPFQRFYIPYY